ncbi:cbb3-type cytochrome oxidase assembly protein CcoS [Mesorhizobium sp. L103C131B0]|uniref:cbb3-type cytochrome oxidase assembly protein n=1 Tax=Mesorhizobium sp. L103C131B0 TaxID=1287089 RepID=UPI0003D028C5|nr:hypothetical protein X729_26945 [Mesorhizobium sp. L103C131B0]
MGGEHAVGSKMPVLTERWPLPVLVGLGPALPVDMKSGQYEDLDGSAQRILIDREEPRG